jgi:hypothetical protein
MVGFYYESLDSGGPETPAACSAILDGYGWTSSWRAQDADEILWSAVDPLGSGSRLLEGIPALFTIDTSTMVLAATVSPSGMMSGPE